jgi:eukaryotic-like serine/threonine-protein kinase
MWPDMCGLRRRALASWEQCKDKSSPVRQEDPMTSLTTSDVADAPGMQALRPSDPWMIGRYRLLGQLGQGGMGRVFLGLSEAGSPVAVKVLHAELAADPEFRMRFRREVAAARTVSGMFTALVLDADVDGPMPWLATAYVAGPSLAQAVRECGPMSEDSVLSLAAGLAEGLAAIHAAGLVHRDLKPSNVLLAGDGPRVIDFGICKMADATPLTVAGFMVGSPGFMSPEQAEGGVVGPASDIFNLGVVLAFAATGKEPFGGGSSATRIRRMVHSAPDLDGLPGRIRPLVESCLAKDPGGRPSVVEFLARVSAASSVAADSADPVRVADLSGSAGEDLSGPSGEDLIAADRKRRPLARVAARRRRARGRRRMWRPLAVAAVSGTLLAASATAGFALAGSGHQASGKHLRLQVARPLTAPPAVSASGAGTTAPSPAPEQTRRPRPAASVRPRQSPTPPPALVPVEPTQTYSPPAPTPTPRPSPRPRPRPRPSPKPSVTPRPQGDSISASGASQDSCSDEGVIHSVASTAEVPFTFVNDSATTVDIIWLNFAGSRVLYAVLSPDTSYRVDTYVGHDWLIAGSGGGCVGVFDIDGSGDIVITS